MFCQDWCYWGPCALEQLLAWFAGTYRRCLSPQQWEPIQDSWAQWPLDFLSGNPNIGPAPVTFWGQSLSTPSPRQGQKPATLSPLEPETSPPPQPGPCLPPRCLESTLLEVPMGPQETPPPLWVPHIVRLWCDLSPFGPSPRLLAKFRKVS